MKLILSLFCACVMSTGLMAEEKAFKLEGDTAALWNFAEGEGKTLRDEGPVGIVLRFADAQNLPTWVDGKFGKALFFPGAASLEVASTLKDTSAFTSMTEVTFEAWIKLDPEGAKTERAIFQHCRWQQWGFRLGLSPNSEVKWLLQTGQSEVALHSKIKVPMDEWVHLAATYDGEIMRIYINGEKAGEKGLSGAVLQSPGFASFNVGIMGGATHPYFRGAINAIRISNKAHTQFDVR